MAPEENRKSKRIIARNKKHNDHAYALRKKASSYDHLHFDSNYKMNRPSKPPPGRPKGRPIASDSKQKISESRTIESMYQNSSNHSKSNEINMAIRRARNKEAVRRSRERSRRRHVEFCQQKIESLRNLNASLINELAELRRTVRILRHVHAILSNK